MPLVVAPTGVDLIVIKLLAEESIVNNLQEKGLVVGAVITLQEISAGSLIVKIGETRLVLDKNVAVKILVNVQ